MPTTRWRDLKHKATPEQQRDIEAEVGAELARLDALKGQLTGGICAGCGEPLRYGDATAVDLVGRDFHTGCG